MPPQREGGSRFRWGVAAVTAAGILVAGAALSGGIQERDGGVDMGSLLAVDEKAVRASWTPAGCAARAL